MYPRAISAIPIDLKHPHRYRRVRLTLDGARQVRLADTGTPQGSWYSAFMGSLGSVNFQGTIEWTYNIDGETNCVALHSLSHPNDAVVVLTTFALELNHLVGWFGVEPRSRRSGLPPLAGARHHLFHDRRRRVDRGAAEKLSGLRREYFGK